MIEDSPDYTMLVEAMLRDGFDGRFRLASHATLEAAEADLQDQATECVLLDLSLPDARGLEALERIQALAPQVPVVVLSGDDDERVAVDAVQQGAQDYLVKRDARASLLARAIRYAIERKRVELELSYLALHDSLTGLANRALFLDRLELALARSKRAGTWVAVVFCDLDRFKNVNDSLGHELGDRLLAEAARRLDELVRPMDTVARFGGDEFMVLCDELSDEATAVRIAERLTGGMNTNVQLGPHSVHVSISAGIALARGGDSTPEELIRNADKTMYEAKQGRRPFALYDEVAHAGSLQRLELESQLHGALGRDELDLCYQPIVDLRSDRPIGFEALLRWRHPDRGLLAPRDFLETAIETGLIFEIGEWVLDRACTQLSTWSDDPDLFVSVNLSPLELIRPELPSAVAASLDRTGLAPSRLQLEVTEHSVASDPERLLDVLRRLRDSRVRVALDDFGTGHSSLSALSRYPLDAVKLDRSFLARLAEDERHERMLKAVIDVCHAFALTVVAEGVERPEQLARARGFGCDQAQGFLFAEPAPADQAGRLLETSDERGVQ